MLLPIVDELLVNLIGKDDNILVGGHFPDGPEFLLGINRPGGVARGIDDDHLGSRRHGLLELLGGHLPSVLLGGLHDDRLRPAETHHLRIAHPVGAGDDHLVPLIAHRHDGVHTGLLATRGDADLLRLIFQAVVIEEFSRNGLAQLGNTSCRSILGLTLLKSLDRRRLDVVGGIHFRLTAGETVDFITLRPQGLGLIGDRQSKGGSDSLNA